MDSRIGLDYIVENREYISKLGAALDTNNAVVKKQVFELLSALCAYNKEGYVRAIETLEFYKNLKNERYRFKIVINELEKATNVEYQVALLAFINCVIISASNLQDRIRIRNEFIGLKVLPLLNNIRRVSQSVGDIIVQLDVFEEQRECDEAQSLQGPNGINLNSHLDVFYAILRQVADTPQEVPFLSILQHLLRIDPKEAVSDVIWDTTEKLVHRATLLETHEDSIRLLRTSSGGPQKYTCTHCRGEATSSSRKPSGVLYSPSNASITASATSIQHNGPLSPATAEAVASPIPPPPAAPTGFSNGVPPPPPPPLQFNFGSHVPPAPPPPRHSTGGAPPAPPPPAPNNLLANKAIYPVRPVTPELEVTPSVLLPQQDTPAPKTKMKTINWGKIPPNKVIGKQNIWTIVASNHQHSPMADLDWNEMEGLFCLQSTSTQGSPKLGRDNGGNGTNTGYDTLDRKSAKKDNMEITLLDGKRSLNVNIFLKQFRTDRPKTEKPNQETYLLPNAYNFKILLIGSRRFNSNEDIIRLIHDGAHDEIGAEKLRGLLKILPEVDELDMLKSFNGDRNRLGNAEKFLLQLLEVPNYKLRIESMLLKEEFAANVSYLEPCINAMIYAGDDLVNNKMLQEVLYMVVVAGNFLNSGGYAGNAVGVKLSSLQKLTDIRANKPGMNLIHFVAMQAERRNPALLQFTTQLSILENASKTTSEQINNEINTLDARIRKIKRQVEQSTTDEDIKEQMWEFLQTAEREVAVLQAGMKEVEVMRLKLADFFCEDPATFRLEECFKIFQTFCDKFKQAAKENERRMQLEEQATLRRKQREEQLARRARQVSQCSTPVSDSENLLDVPFDPRASPALSRRRMGSFNSGVDINNAYMRSESNDGVSPDITPNGSLRRRRSRVLPEEDDLMEFLRSSSGHENNSRERKAYGSLDRSWARRGRSGSASRKRPELFNMDFGADRERAGSPAPSQQQNRPASSTAQAPSTRIVNVPHTQDDIKPRISREWRQKIETWLQSNENDEKQNEEYKRKRRLVNSNRRSLENDAESERKLDTLPEEKIVWNTTTAANTPTTTPTNSNTNIDSYKRVYSDWKPSKTLEQTDVVGTIQAIATAINNGQEKPHWRKSSHQRLIKVDSDESLRHTPSNPNNSDIQELYRRQTPLETTASLQTLEDDRRRSYIQKLGERDATDRLKIYVRRSSHKDVQHAPPTIEVTKTPTPSAADSTSPLTKSASNTKVHTDSVKSLQTSKSPSEDDTFASLLNHHKSHNEKYSRKEIDADNIETPPVTRRVIYTPSATIITVNTTNDRDTGNVENADPDTPGYFDRYSLTRRTRRYKRPTDYSSGNEEPTTPKEPNTNEPSSPKQSAQVSSVKAVKNPLRVETLREPLAPKRTIHKLEKVGRHISSINQEDVREAIRNLKSPTGTPERIWSPPRDILSHQPSPTVSTTRNTIDTTNGQTLIKVSNHELNDEGFEETQSLVSDTPSHGKDSTNSSCNEANELLPPTNTLKSTAQKSHTVTKQPTTTTTTSSRLADRLQISKLRSTLPPSQSHKPLSSTPNIQAASKRGSNHPSSGSRTARVPHGPLPNSTTQYANSAIRRANSLRKPPAVNDIAPTHTTQNMNASSSHVKRDVERSSSRNSLRSSRSSINSAISTNTVVRRGPNAAHEIMINKTPTQLQTTSADASPNKRPLSAQNTSPYVRGSAGHHVNPNSAVYPRMGGGGGGVPASRSSSSGSSIGANVVVRKVANGIVRATYGPAGGACCKENATYSNSGRAGNLGHARSPVVVKTVMVSPPPNANKKGGSRNFMRPTTSSTTKRSK